MISFVLQSVTLQAQETRTAQKQKSIVFLKRLSSTIKPMASANECDVSWREMGKLEVLLTLVSKFLNICHNIPNTTLLKY